MLILLLVVGGTGGAENMSDRRSASFVRGGEVAVVGAAIEVVVGAITLPVVLSLLLQWSAQKTTIFV